MSIKRPISVLSVLLLATALFTSCTKEELIAPCHEEPGPAELRHATIPANDGGSTPEGSNGIPVYGQGHDTDRRGGAGISDDGDDQPDRERSNKSGRQRN